MPALILASTSPYRRELLSRLGTPFRAIAPTFDEESRKHLALPPAELALLLAREKAASIARLEPSSYVLGCDQMVELDGEVLGKPGSPERALAQLERLRGRAHRLLTAFVLLGPDGSSDEHVDLHTLHMRELSTAELTRYVVADQPFDCAGSYKIEARGITLCERIEGDDFTAITGLPLIALSRALRSRGFAIP